MNTGIAILIGVSGGLLASVVTSMFSSFIKRWKQKRHDYGQLLIALHKNDYQDVKKRMELAALIAPAKIKKLIMNKLNEIRKKSSQSINYTKIHDELFDKLYDDLEMSRLMKIFFSKIW
ncbi:MAG: hypothetical protein ACOC56_00730 [Atribacterota bacterium]